MPHVTEIKNKILSMNDARFQILCDAYLSLDGYQHIISLGTCANAEKTTSGTPDTYFSDGEDYIFAEYTTQKDNIFAKISKDLEKCFDKDITDISDEHLKQIVYCHISSNLTTKQTRALKELCSSHGVPLRLIGLDELAFGINEKYPFLAKDYLGISLDTQQIQRSVDFIQNYDLNRLAAPLETEFQSRKKELQQIDDAFQDVSVVMLTGNAGVGKTRLALEYAQNHAQNSHETLYVIHHRNLPIWEDLRRYFQIGTNYFLVIDDANEVSELKLILEHLQSLSNSCQIKILITVRDYAAKIVEHTASCIIEYKKVDIYPLSEDEIQSIVTSQYKIRNPQWLKRIAVIAEGNARIAVLAAKFASESGNLLDIQDASQLYDQYFDTVLQSMETKRNKSILLVAGFTSFFNIIRLDHLESILPILQKFGISKQIMHDTLYQLHTNEIVDIYQDKAVRFSDQCFANYILKKMLIDDKKVCFSQLAELCFRDYPERVVLTSNMLCEVFRSQEVTKHIYSEIISVWEKFKKKDSSLFWEFAKQFYPVNPLDMLLLLKKKIDDCSPVILTPEDIDTEKGKNHYCVSDEFLQILGGYAGLAHMQTALELLFRYYLKRPDLYMQIYHTITQYFEVDRNSFYENFESQITLAKTIETFSDNWDNKYITILFLDLAEHFLGLLFQPVENGRKAHSLILNTIFLSAKPYILEFRKLLWDALYDIAKKKLCHNQIRKLLNTYGNALEPACFPVIENDCKYLEQLISIAFSDDCLADCIAAGHVQKILQRANVDSPVIKKYANSPKMNLYKMLKGELSYSNFGRYEEAKALQHKQLISYLFSFRKPEDGFCHLLELFCECENPLNISYGINEALVLLNDYKDSYLLAVQAAIDHGIVHNLNPIQIVSGLFKITSTEQIFQIISRAKDQDLEHLLYGFYHELPPAEITEQWLDSLYRFFSEALVCKTETASFRDISFLNNYIFLDRNIIFKIGELLLDNSVFSTYMYFWLYFQQNEPKQIVDFWKEHLDTLKKLYIAIDGYDSFFDSNGFLLLELCKCDPSFIVHYTNCIIAKQYLQENPKMRRMQKLFLLDQFCEVIDNILQQVLDTNLEHYILYYALRNWIKVFVLVPSSEIELIIPSDIWIKHYIKEYNTDHEKMALLFDVLSELPNERKLVYIQLFLKYNRNFDDFQALHFSPSIYCISESLIPMYQKQLEYLESILPMLLGIDFLEHNKLIYSLIECLKKEIENEELQAILDS